MTSTQYHRERFRKTSYLLVTSITCFIALEAIHYESSNTSIVPLLEAYHTSHQEALEDRSCVLSPFLTCILFASYLVSKLQRR
jgi:hypothetical protein